MSVDTQNPVPAGMGGQMPEASPERVGGIGSGHTNIPTDPGEMIEHVKEYNTIDNALRDTFFFLTQFSWLSSRKAGDLLWSNPITPYAGFPNLQYISKVYNAWSGSLQYSVGVAGTGFMGGKLRVVKYPPNIEPKSSSISRYTMFPYFFIDPKELNYIDMNATDVRNVLYHWAEKQLGRDDIGGYIAIHVELPLVGEDSVNLEVLQKVGRDFNFSQLLYPDNDVTPEVFPSYFSFGKFADRDNFAFFDSFWKVSKLTILAEPTMPVHSTFAFDGSVTQSRPSFDLLTNLEGKTRADGSIERFDSGLYGFEFRSDLSGGLGFKSIEDATNPGPTDVGNVVANFDTNPVAFTSDSAIPIDDRIIIRENIDPNARADYATELMRSEPHPLGESAVVFGGDGEGGLGGMALPYTEMIFLKEGMFADLVDTSSTPVFTLIDKETELGLAFVRLNSNGTLSSSLLGEAQVFELKDIELRFFETIPERSPLPSSANTNFAANRLLYQFKRASRIKK